MEAKRGRTQNFFSKRSETIENVRGFQRGKTGIRSYGDPMVGEVLL